MRTVGVMGDGAHRQQHGESLPDRVVETGQANLLEEDRVHLAQQVRLLARDIARDADGQARPWEGMPSDDRLGDAQLAAKRAHLVDDAVRDPRQEAHVEGIDIRRHAIGACHRTQRAGLVIGAPVAHDFHDYKAEGIGRARLEGWVRELGWESLLNRGGTTFRKLPEAEKADLDAARAIALLVAYPSAIKRPMLDTGAALTLGFRPESYAALFPG